jgi:hypothetical protein
MSDVQANWLAVAVTGLVWCSIIVGAYARLEEARALEPVTQEHGEAVRIGADHPDSRALMDLH